MLRQQQIKRLENFVIKLPLLDIYILPTIFVALVLVMHFTGLSFDVENRHLAPTFADNFLQYSRKPHEITSLICAYKITIQIGMIIFVAQIISIPFTVYIAIRSKATRWYRPEYIPKVNSTFEKYPLGLFGLITTVVAATVVGFFSITKIDWQMKEPALKFLFDNSGLLFFSLNVLVISVLLSMIYVFIFGSSMYFVNYIAGWPRW